jgi:uncharacterized protein (DUF1330 family)
MPGSNVGPLNTKVDKRSCDNHGWDKTHMNHTSFTKEDFTAFRANDRPGPIQMLNLIRLREQANYPDGRAATGADAYAAYSHGSRPVFARLGGKIIWRGRLEQTLIGPREEAWNICFVAEYPSVAAFAEMLRDPAYRSAMEHRQAAIADSRLVRLAPMTLGIAFADPEA